MFNFSGTLKSLGVVVFCFCLSSISLFAEECLFDATGDDAGVWQAKNLKVVDDAENAEKCCCIDGYANISAKKLIPVDINKTYKLSGWFKSAGSEKSKLYFGLMCYDSQKRHIGSSNIGAFPGTETELTAAVKKGAKSLEIKDGKKWQELLKKGRLKYASIAFNVDDSGKMNDLPNFNLSPYRAITNIEEKGETWTVELSQPIQANFPAGTKVRLHTAGGTYLYCAAANKTLSDKWTECAGTLHGESKCVDSGGKFRRGTAFVKVFFFANFQAKTKGSVMCFKNIKFEEVE